MNVKTSIGSQQPAITFFDLNSFILQQFTKLLNFFLKLANEFCIRVLIDDGFAHDLFRSVSISDRDQRLLLAPYNTDCNAHLNVLKVSS